MDLGIMKKETISNLKILLKVNKIFSKDVENNATTYEEKVLSEKYKEIIVSLELLIEAINSEMVDKENNELNKVKDEIYNIIDKYWRKD